MTARRRALLWLPDLDVATLQWAAHHPVYRTGLARWWQRGNPQRYLPAGSRMSDVVWPQAEVRWDDVAVYLRQRAEIAPALHAGATLHLATTTSARDMLAVALWLVKTFPAATIAVDLIVDSYELLPAWLTEAALTVQTLIPAAASPATVRRAMVGRQGVEISHPTKAQAYVQGRKDWTPVILDSKNRSPVVTVLDDRLYDWDGLDGLRVSTLLASRSPSLWQLLAGRSDAPHIAVHQEAAATALHTARAESVQRFGALDAVLAEVYSTAPALLTVIEAAPSKHDWSSYDDRLALLIANLTNQGYELLVFGVPTASTDQPYPVFFLGSNQPAARPSHQKTAHLADLQEAVWSFAGVTDSPSWLLSDFLLS